ncbi:unnamed protein product [Linum trigynum]
MVFASLLISFQPHRIPGSESESRRPFVRRRSHEAIGTIRAPEGARERAKLCRSELLPLGVSHYRGGQFSRFSRFDPPGLEDKGVLQERCVREVQRRSGG